MVVLLLLLMVVRMALALRTTSPSTTIVVAITMLQLPGQHLQPPIRAGHHQRNRRRNSPQKQTQKRRKPQPVHRIHYVMTEQHPHRIKDIKQWPTTGTTIAQDHVGVIAIRFKVPFEPSPELVTLVVAHFRRFRVQVGLGVSQVD